MGLLGELESKKYKSVLDLIKSEEVYDKKRSTISGLETLELLHKRFLRLRSIFAPLKEKLGNNIEITDIEFNQGMQEIATITIKYLKDGKQCFVSVSNLEFGQFEIVLSDNEIENDVFLMNNRRIFSNLFKNIDECNLSGTDISDEKDSTITENIIVDENTKLPETNKRAV